MANVLAHNFLYLHIQHTLSNISIYLESSLRPQDKLKSNIYSSLRSIFGLQQLLRKIYATCRAAELDDDCLQVTPFTLHIDIRFIVNI